MSDLLRSYTDLLITQFSKCCTNNYIYTFMMYMSNTCMYVHTLVCVYSANSIILLNVCKLYNLYNRCPCQWPTVPCRGPPCSKTPTPHATTPWADASRDASNAVWTRLQVTFQISPLWLIFHATTQQNSIGGTM